MKTAPFSPDLREFLALLGTHRVRYVVVGGEAVIYHGYARLTGHLDLFFDASPTNAQRLYDALLEFWAGSIPSIAAAADLRVRSTVFRFGVPPNRLELLNAIDGVSFEAGRPRLTTP